LHGDAVGAIGEAGVEFVLNGDEGFDVALAGVFEGLADVLDVDDGEAVAGPAGAFVEDEAASDKDLSAAFGEEFEDFLAWGGLGRLGAERPPCGGAFDGRRGRGGRADGPDGVGVEDAVVVGVDEGDGAGRFDDLQGEEARNTSGRFQKAARDNGEKAQCRYHHMLVDLNSSSLYRRISCAKQLRPSLNLLKKLKRKSLPHTCHS
jgi:hypothetical protein